jgi:hypothetical protein
MACFNAGDDAASDLLQVFAQRFYSHIPQQDRAGHWTLSRTYLRIQPLLLGSLIAPSASAVFFLFVHCTAMYRAQIAKRPT